jgi:formylglycine-generating enzyme required for sulfatase activity
MRIAILAPVAMLVVLCCAATPTTKPAADKSIQLPDLKMTLIRIEPGTFEMGSPADEAGREDNELLHTVKITKPFYLMSGEVSQAQYKAVLGENPSYFHGDDSLPVENVSWDDAVRFCEKLSAKEHRKFRLPTEAEWEYAARAGTTGPVAGSGKLDEISWHADNSGKKPIDSVKLWADDPSGYFKALIDNGCKSRPVASGKPNDWGLHDMQGNVTEWVADWFSDDYFKTDAAKTDPTGPEKSPVDSRVMRGGSWGSDPAHCRIAHREWNVPSTQSGTCGFRVAMDER